MGSGKHRWKISFRRSPSTTIPFLNPQKLKPPDEFLCPISGCLMSDPVIVTSGHTFERNCVLACNSLSFKPILLNLDDDGSTPDFSTIIPNRALKSTILNWCHSSLLNLPKPIDFPSAQKLVLNLISSQNPQPPPSTPPTSLTFVESVVELKNRRPSHFSSSSSSEESVTDAVSCPVTPLFLVNTPPSFLSSSSSSSDLETLITQSAAAAAAAEDEELIFKLRSSQVFQQEQAAVSLRNRTRMQEDARIHLCTPRLLSALQSLIISKYASVQVNSVAALVNLSLEDQNKVKIVRSGIVPPLIDVLRCGFQEAQEHAAGALFSLALHNDNKTAIGVLGALPPLLHALRSDSERTRHDSALALYHLSRVQSNRAKLVKLGSVQVLLGMAKSGHMTGRVLLVLCNLAASAEGRAAMLDAGAVQGFVEMLSRDEFESESSWESCVGALEGLSQGGLRFKGLAKEAGAEDVLMKAVVEEEGSERARAKAKKIVQVLRSKEEDDEEVVNWEELLSTE